MEVKSVALVRYRPTHEHVNEAFSANNDVNCSTKPEIWQNNDLQREITDVVEGTDPYRCYRLAKQASLVGVWISLGLFLEIVGPTMQDLKDRVGVNYEEISRAMAGKEAGAFVGALIGGILHEKYSKFSDLIIAISLVAAAISSALTPWTKWLGVIGVLFSINGLSEGLINTGGNTMVMKLWGEDTPAPMHSLHFGFGVGAVIAPQIARPFLAPDASNSNTTVNGTSQDMNSYIEYPYTIIAICVFLYSLVIFGFFIKGPPKGFPVKTTKTNFRKMCTPRSCAPWKPIFGAQLLAVLAIHFGQIVGGERAYGKFIFSYATDSELKFTKSDASILNSVYWACFTAGRLAGVPTARFVPTRYMIVMQICATIICSFVLAAEGYKQAAILWAFSCIIGYFMAQKFPSGMSWANIYLEMNSLSVMIVLFGGYTGGLIYQYLAGYFFQNSGPRSLMYVMIVYSTGMSVIFLCLQLLANTQGDRFSREQTPEHELEVDNPDDADVEIVGIGKPDSQKDVTKY